MSRRLIQINRLMIALVILMSLNLSRPSDSLWAGQSQEPSGKIGATAPSPSLVPTESDQASPAVRGLTASIRAFRKYASPLGYTHCPMYPSCSHFGEEALKIHGAWWGTLLIVDRFIRESQDMRDHPEIKVDGQYRAYDPLKQNDFWLRDRPPRPLPMVPHAFWEGNARGR
ncbi:MAG: membrane protein insertion efficiency factor YidD [Deltaproteobacteria bacterium]|nr:membrane protein insertion efficiency factor YidD [Deltaproteobacteria bacterium]